MLATWPMIDADARPLEEPAHGERQERRGLVPPLLGGERVLGVLDGQCQAPGLGPCRAVRSPFT
jgi:hypothetical protein